MLNNRDSLREKVIEHQEQIHNDHLIVEKNSVNPPNQNNKYKAIIFKNRGYFHYKKEDYENSIQNYRRAVEIDPNYIDAWCDLGLVYYTIGNLEESNKCLDKLDSLKGNKKR